MPESSSLVRVVKPVQINNVFLLFSLTVVAILAFVITVVWLRHKLQEHDKNNYLAQTPDSIEALETLTINGNTQWLHIRGRDRTNPLLVIFHGGSGDSQIGWFDHIQRPWEDFFTVVQWDQRGAGKSYKSTQPLIDTMTNPQMVEDAEAVIQFLRDKFNHEKVFLLGKSYGSYLGMNLVHRHPDWFYAYIGDGQMISVAGFAEAEYQHLLKAAKTEHNEQLVEHLEKIAPRINPDQPWQSYIQHEDFILSELDKRGKGISPLGTNIINVFSVRTVNRFLSHLISWPDLFHTRFATKPLNKNDNTFSKAFMSVDLPREIGHEFKVPIILFAGRHDWHVPFDYQRQWFDAINAPYKEMVVFQNSRHYPYLEEPGKYLIALVNILLPLSGKE